MDRNERFAVPSLCAARRLSAFAVLAVLLSLLLIFASQSSAADPEVESPAPVVHTPAEIAEAISNGEETTDPQAAVGLDGNSGRAEALSAMEGVFGHYLEAPSGVFDDLKVKKFLSNNVAVVAPDQTVPGAEPGTTHGAGLLESTLPLRTESILGDEPVDLSLEHAEGEIQPANPLVEVGIPTSLEEGIELPGIQIQVDAAASPTATITQQNVAFYPDVARDTDLAIAPTPTGVETLSQLRTAQAPDSQTFDLSLPPDAILRATPDGGAESTVGATPILKVLPPTAIDAAGNPVEVTLNVAGDSLVVEARPDGSTQYPVLVDPNIEDLYHWESGAEGWPGWTSYKTPPSESVNTYTWPEHGCSTYCYLSNGANPGGWIWANTSSSWSYAVPRYQSDYQTYGTRPTDWIGCFTVGNMVFNGEGDYGVSPGAIFALTSEAGAWTSEALYPPNQSGGYGTCTSDQRGKLAGFGLFASANSLLAQPRYLLVGYSQIIVVDEGAPVIAAIGNPTKWVDTAPQTFPITASDTGLGIYYIQITNPTNGAVLGNTGAKNGSANCIGNDHLPCPHTWKGEQEGNLLSYNPSSLPQGTDSLQVNAVDPVGNRSTPATIKVKVDHTNPVLAVSGTVRNQVSLGTSLPRYSVIAEASDGTSAAPQSGVASIEIKVDGKTKSSWAPGCSTQNCTLTEEGFINASEYAVGKHTVEVVAKDAVGRSSAPTVIPIEITRDTTKPQLTGSGSLISGPQGWVSQQIYSLRGEAKDPGGSGATKLELKLDNKLISSETATCANGGCTLVRTFSVNLAAYAGGAHTATMLATDGAGNVTACSWQLNVDPIGSVTGLESIHTLEAVEGTSAAAPIAPPEKVIPAEEVREGNDPGLVLADGVYESDGTAVVTTVGAGPKPTVGLETPEGEVKIEPVGLTASGSSLAGEAAAVSVNTSGSADTITRPLYDGFMQFQSIRDPSAPEEYVWRIELFSGQRLQSVPGEQAVAVYDEDGTEAFLISAEQAHDAVGVPVNTTLSVQGSDEVALKVHHRVSGITYPVVAGPTFATGYAITITAPHEEGPPSKNTEVEGEPVLALELSAPLSPTKENAEEAVAQGFHFQTFTKIKGFNVPACAPLGLCEIWADNTKGFFWYDNTEAWYSRAPKCLVHVSPSFSISQNTCEWVGGNHQPYGEGYHLTVQNFFTVGDEVPPIPDSPKHVTIRCFGDGECFPHNTENVCNPSRPSC